jgi:hypothetical protein
MQKKRSNLEKLLETERASMAVVAVLTALAFALRFYKINHPDQVVCVSLTLGFQPMPDLKLHPVSTRSILANSRHTTFYESTTLMSTLLLQNSSSGWLAGLLVSMGILRSTISGTAIRRTMCRTSA